MGTIICNKNNGYHWIECQGCHFKGYIQTEHGDVIKNEKAISLISSISTYDEFQNVIKNSFGVFSIIIEKGSEVWMAVDIARSMPIYYSSDLNYISDDVEIILRNCNEEYSKLEDIRLLEMYTSSFIGFQNTVYSDIKQLEIGCTARIHLNSIEQSPYYSHGKLIEKKDSNYFQQLEEATENMLSRIKKVIRDRQIVLSLSGGYDSRYLACSLKKSGVDNVICYTYGRADSYEVAQSRKVAEALGYQWHNIEYDDESIRRILKEDEQYLDYANRPDYIVYLQNYLAVKTLTNDHLIPRDAVFITGLCNDMPTGYYIPTEEETRVFGYSNEGVAEYNYRQRFIKFNLSDRAKEIYINDIMEFCRRRMIEVKDYRTFVSALDSLETANFHSHCYLNMNTVHEFFGYEWLLPCWDRELLDFWYSLPIDKRIGQKTYEEYIVNHLGKKYGVGTKKHINFSASTPFKRKMKRMIGGLLVKIAYPLGIPMHRNTDINNMAILEVCLYKRIIQKQAIKSDRAALILLLTIFMMERRYGTEWYKSIKGYLD